MRVTSGYDWYVGDTAVQSILRQWEASGYVASVHSKLVILVERTALFRLIFRRTSERLSSLLDQGHGWEHAFFFVRDFRWRRHRLSEKEDAVSVLHCLA